MKKTNKEYERSMKDRALVNYIVDKQKAVDNGVAGVRHPYNNLVRTMLGVAEKTLLERLKHKKRGKSSISLVALRRANLNPSVVSAIAARTVVDGIVQGDKLQRIATTIGGRIEDEARIEELKHREPLLWKHIEKQLEARGTTNYHARRMVTVAAIMQANSEEQWEPWSLKVKAHIGLMLVDSLYQAGMVKKLSVPGKKRHVKHKYLALAEDVQAALQKNEQDAMELLQPWYKPMLEEPMPWVNPNAGGYFSISTPLVKVRTRAQLSRFETAVMPRVYDAVNFVQSTPWRINKDVLVVVQELLKMRTEGIGGMPMLHELTKPIRPADIPFVKKALLDDDQRFRLVEHLKAKRQWFMEMGKRGSKNVQAYQIIEVAKELQNEPKIYFPHTLDYRGRMYPLPLQLNPQGTDLAKGLLTFSEGRPLGTMGSFWLAVHGANCFGKDKGPLAERVDWVLENQERINSVARDPLSDLWWTEADGGTKPFQFLAFCLEWNAYLESGEDPDFVSCIPVGLDGACNGIQHFSAMLRDPSGAKATNLAADKVQYDVYAEVAEEVNKVVREYKDKSEVDREMAGIWLKFGIDRKVVKRPVMTTPYGATKIGMKDQIVEDTINKNPDQYWGKSTFATAAWLADKIDIAIGNKLVAARQAMLFLQDLAQALAKEDLPMVWTTPTGFPVVQRITRSKEFVVDTHLLDRVKLKFIEEGSKLDRGRQRSAIAPNFVHSYDGAHLQLTVCAMQEELVRRVSWAVVHDSFGVPAGDVDSLSRVLREQFVEMYASRHPLHNLLDQCRPLVPASTELPVPPKVGTFDIKEVLEAEFFFA